MALNQKYSRRMERIFHHLKKSLSSVEKQHFWLNFSMRTLLSTNPESNQVTSGTNINKTAQQHVIWYSWSWYKCLYSHTVAYTAGRHDSNSDKQYTKDSCVTVWHSGQLTTFQQTSGTNSNIHTFIFLQA